MRYLPVTILSILLLSSATESREIDGNRLTYLGASDPYYVSRTFPKLITPQWVGETGVEAVVILSIDDMIEPAKYEPFVRPILERLKQIDGRAPLSIMTCRIDPAHAQLQQWLTEGVGLETHTFDHLCPLLGRGDFAKAKSSYDRCVDLLNDVPGNRPVAFRVPCCDSQNTPSPRFFAEIFNKTTDAHRFLTIDSSVFNIFTSNDPTLPRELVSEPDGRERFRKYLPFPSFVNTIEDYPYPYVIGRLCWEFPCTVPSDWEGQNLNGKNNPKTLEDMKAGLDAAVAKRGTFTLVFHPHGWIRSEQVVDLIDHAVAKHGTKIKFLTFAEVQKRLNENLLRGQPLRRENGEDNGVRLLDVNNDGYIDVAVGNEQVHQTRIWSPEKSAWLDGDFPVTLWPEARFGVLRRDGNASVLAHTEKINGGWHFEGARWIEDPLLMNGLDEQGPVFTSQERRDRGVRMRDLDHDGRCELIVGNEKQQAIFTRDDAKNTWRKLPFALPAGSSFVDAGGKDQGLRLIDVDEDGHDDVIFSNDQSYSLHLFSSMKDGWSREVKRGKRNDDGAIPMIARNGENNGVWFHSRSMWLQNEHTAFLPNVVKQISFNDLLAGVEPQAKTPDASLRSIRVRPGFEVELVACEPLVQDPIALAWGADGKLWVVEMGSYPSTDTSGRIKFLEDIDGDGKYDKATLFLDGLGFPTSAMPWGKGVLVACAPEIFYAEDTDGDGRADVRKVLYRGFVEGNPQHRVNSLSWGLDNWIYGANGDSGGKIESVKTGNIVDIRGRDFRFRPDDGELDAQSGQSQFGRSRDDWGNSFGCNNATPMYQFVLADHYLRRNPHVAAPQAKVQVPQVPGAQPVFPISRTLPRFNEPAGADHFTSACSTIVYRDDLFGPVFSGSMFVSEPVHNLVHRELISPNGVTFTSQRAPDEQASEFLASSDNWFRPTTITTGPDGALWIADMYRAVIEHPEWIPKEWQQRLDLRAGADKGRIYRVYPVGVRPRPIPKLDRMDAAGLVTALDSPSGWQRDMAQQLLVQRQDKSIAPLLEKMASDNARPLARLHALCTLDGLGALTSPILEHALQDSHPGVRRHAVRLCETQFATSLQLAAAAAKLVDDPDLQVRMQLAYSLGSCEDAGAALAQLAIKNVSDPFISIAVLSSITPQNLSTVVHAVIKANRDPASAELWGKLLRISGALGNRAAVAQMLAAVVTTDQTEFSTWQLTVLAGFAESLDPRNRSLHKLSEQADDELRRVIGKLSPAFDAARVIAMDVQTPEERRLLAVRMLGRGIDRQTEDLSLLAKLLVPQSSEQLQAGVITSLAALRDPAATEVLLRGWKGYGPSLRTAVLGVLLQRDETTAALLDAIESHQVLPTEIDASRRQRLLQHQTAALQERAAKLLASAVNPNRQKVLEAFESAATLVGDASHGAQIFAKTCVACHEFGGVGRAVGPDLASVGDKTPRSLLTAIIDPNRAVESRYTNYVLETNGGLFLTGILTGETANSVALTGSDAKVQSILRSDIKKLRGTGTSLMPEGLETGLTPQDMADLIAHLRSTSPGPKPKSFEGNTPAVVKADAKGTFRLLPSSAEIYGSTLVFEPKNGNLEYWSSEDDHAIWTVDPSQAGKYEVWLQWSCDKKSAENQFTLQAGQEQFTARVASTGTWSDFKRAKVGEVSLGSGRQRINIRSVGKVTGALMDLTAVELIAVSGK